MRTCTATIHHGSYFEQFTGFGANDDAAFDDVVVRQGTGYQPSRANDASVHKLLALHKEGDLPVGDLSDGNVTMRTATREVCVGWVTYTWATVRLWAVQATATPLTDNGFDSNRQVPTFYLDPAVQGIVSQQGAEDVAKQILTAGTTRDVELRVHVEPIA